MTGFWVTLAFVITSGYSGNLKAFLTTPKMSEPIDTVEKLVESGLPWSMTLYGEAIEDELANSEDPVIQKFWKEKIVVPHSQFPLEEVRIRVFVFDATNHSQ